MQPLPNAAPPQPLWPRDAEGRIRYDQTGEVIHLADVRRRQRSVPPPPAKTVPAELLSAVTAAVEIAVGRANEDIPTRAEIQELTTKAAKAAVGEVFAGWGVDITNVTAMYAFNRRMIAMQESQETFAGLKKHFWMVVVGLLALMLVGGVILQVRTFTVPGTVAPATGRP